MGAEAIRSIEKSVRKTEKIALKGFDKKDRQVLTDLLSKIEANLNGTGFEGVDDDENVDVDA
jgi:DNA-binding MarR family transcriptional regulator